MTRLKATWFFVAVLLGGLAQSQDPPWLERQFSVEMVIHDAYLDDEVDTGQLFVGDRQMRLEMEQEGVVLLYDFREGEMVMRILMPDERMYMEWNLDLLDPDDAFSLFVLFRPEHPMHPCQSAPERYRCENLGADELDGAIADHWRIEEIDEYGDTWPSLAWFDQETGLALRIEDEEDTIVEFHNYQFGPQPAHLFEVPEDYQPFEMPDFSLPEDD